MKRILSGILSLMMVFSLTPTKIAFAENNNTGNVTQSEESNGSGSQGIEQEGTSKIDYSQIAMVNASSEVNGNGDSQDAQSNSSELTGEAKTSENDDEENLNHTHTLSSDSTVINKNTLVRKCTNSDCDYYEIIAKFTAEDMNFTGNEYDESSLLTLWKKDASMKEDRITYKSSDGNGYTSSTPPTDVGKYVATTKVDNDDWYELNVYFEIKNTISPSSNTVTITKGGTYNIEGGEYTSNESAIVVNTTEDVTLNILGDIEYNVTQDSDVSFIDIQNTGEVIINATQDNINYKISSSTSLKLIRINSNANVTVNGGIYEYCQYAIYESELLTNNNNVLTLNGCEIIDSTWSESVGAKNIKLKNCHFLGIPFCNIFVYENGNVTFEGENELSCNEGVINVFLATNATLTLKDDFKNTNGNDLEIGVLNLLTVGDSRQITRDTSETLMSKIVSSDGYVVTKKNGNVYFWNHEHSYVPELSESNDSLIAKCENSDCNELIVLASLNAVNTDFTSKSYSGASVTLKEDYEDSIIKDDVKYKEKDAADTEYSTTVPTQVGKYTASVTLTYDSKDYTLTKDFEITNTISPSSNTVTITKGGTYNIEGGNYYVTNGEYAIVVNTDEKVILNVLGDISCHDNEGEIYQGFINIKGSGEVIVNSNNHTIETNNAKSTMNITSNAAVTLNDGIYKHNYIYTNLIDSKSTKELTLNNCELTGGYVIVEANNISINNCVFNLTDMDGVAGKNIKISKCTFNCNEDSIPINVSEDGLVTLDGKITFSSNTDSHYEDILLHENAKISFGDNFKAESPIKVNLYDSDTLTDESVKRVITTSGISEDMLKMVASADSNYLVNYGKDDNEEGYLYIWKHAHDWKYKLSDYNYSNIIAYCANEDCSYHDADDYNATLSLKETVTQIAFKYTGQPYDGLQFVNNITSVTGVEPSTITYKGINGTEYEKSSVAPINAGEYSASVTFADVTAHVDFEIFKLDQQSAPSGLTSTNETTKGDNDGTITGVDSSMEYRKDGDTEYTSIEGNSVTGLAPGTYYVRYVETTNYNASSDVEITIEQGKDRLINKVELTINAPTGGQNLDETITSSTAGVKSVSLNWTDSTNNDKEGIAEYYPWAYTAHITVTPDTGYKIDENVEVTINGYNIGEPTSINEGVLSFTQEFYSTKHQLTSVTAPKTPETFNSFYYSKDAVINSNSQLVNTVTAVVDGENVQLPITWSIDNYDEKDGVENTFNWTVNFDKENYDVSDSCVTSGSVKIKNKKLIPVTITPTNATIKYDGSTIDVSKYFVISETSSDAAYSLSNGKGKLDGTILTVEETGEFKVHVSTQQKGDYADASADVTLTIEKGDIKYIATGYDGTYDGNEHSISVDAKNANVTYSTDGANYSSNNPSFKDAGEYTVYYRMEANNYNTVNDKATVKISKKTITGTITPNGGTYGSTIKGATVELNGLVGEDNPTITLTYDGFAEVPTNAGTYKVVASIDDKNYSLSETSTEFVIDKANPSLSVSAVSDKTYGDDTFNLDAKQSGTGTLTYSSSNEKVVKVDSTGKVTIVGAGNAKLIVKVDESDNYTSSSAAVDVKVKKANGKLEVSKLTYNKTYGDEPFSIGATSETGAVSYKSNNNNVVTVDSNGLVSIVGVGEATISVDVASSDNYDRVSKNVKIVVGAKTNTETTTFDSKTYDNSDSESTNTTDGAHKSNGVIVSYKPADYTIIPAQVEQMKENADGSIQYGKGTITVGGSILNSKIELVKMLIKDGSISSDKLNSVYNGSTLAILLKITDVSDSLSSDIKSTMNDTTTKTGFTIGNQYLDISLYIGDKTITTTSDKLKITIDVPESMINSDSKIKRTYYVVRYHDGEASSIDGIFDEKAKTFTFETDKFSAYALAYKDEKVSENTTNPSSSESTNTNAHSNIGLYAGLIVVVIIGAVLLIKRNKSEQ